MTAYYNEFDPDAAAWLRELIADGLIAPGDVDERSIIDVSANDIKGYGQCHWFAGIGGWSYALRLAQRPEYLGKVIRWYYGKNSPGPIVNAVSGNIVPLSYGAQPCMTLPDEFPSDVDYDWYIKKSMQILVDIGYK